MVSNYSQTLAAKQACAAALAICAENRESSVQEQAFQDATAACAIADEAFNDAYQTLMVADGQNNEL